MDKYQDRKDAGLILAKSLGQYANRDDVIVLGLPRGGVPVAYQVANQLNVPLDVFIVRKLGVPGLPELAMGAIAMGDVNVFNESIIRDLHVPKEAIQNVMASELKELGRREKTYRGDRPFPQIKDKTVILVDDGIATGATMRAAVKALCQLLPREIVVAVPVADSKMVAQLGQLAELVVCPMQPAYFSAVGEWYADFSQTEDAEVARLLKAATELPHPH